MYMYKLLRNDVNHALKNGASASRISHRVFFRCSATFFRLTSTIFHRFSKVDMIWKLELFGEQVFYEIEKSVKL